MAEENTPIRLIDAVDKKTHDLLFRVMQKLQGIHAEIDAKIESAKIDPNLYPPEIVNKFRNLYYETDKSLDSVKNIIHTQLDTDVNVEEYRQQNAQRLDQLASNLNTFVIKVTEIIDNI